MMAEKVTSSFLLAVSGAHENFPPEPALAGFGQWRNPPEPALAAFEGVTRR